MLQVAGLAVMTRSTSILSRCLSMTLPALESIETGECTWNDLEQP